MPDQAIEQSDWKTRSQSWWNNRLARFPFDNRGEVIVAEPKIKIKVNGQEKEVTQNELIELAQKGEDYTIKTQKLAEQEKTLKAEQERVAGLKSIVDEMDTDPKLKETLNRVYSDYKSGRISKSPEAVDRNLKLIDKRIAEATDPAVKEDLREIKDIIAESAKEIAEQIANEKVSKLQDELAAIKSAAAVGHSERIEGQLVKLEEKFGADLVSKYRRDIIALSLKYPHQPVQKLLYNFADDAEIETAILANAKKKEKEELDRKKRNASPAAGEGSFTAKTALDKDKAGRVTFSSLKQRVLERMGKV